MHLERTALLASIDETLAAMRAALAAGADPEQTDEARAGLAARAGAHLARLPAEDPDGEWAGVPPGVFDAIREAHRAGLDEGLAGAERRLTAARELLGGPSV